MAHYNILLNSIPAIQDYSSKPNYTSKESKLKISILSFFSCFRAISLILRGNRILWRKVTYLFFSFQVNLYLCVMSQKCHFRPHLDILKIFLVDISYIFADFLNCMISALDMHCRGHDLYFCDVHTYPWHKKIEFFPAYFFTPKLCSGAVCALIINSVNLKVVDLTTAVKEANKK